MSKEKMAELEKLYQSLHDKQQIDRVKAVSDFINNTQKGEGAIYSGR